MHSAIISSGVKEIQFSGKVPILKLSHEEVEFHRKEAGNVRRG